MAELATIARPYAEALFKASAGSDASAWAEQLTALGEVVADADLRRFADHPKASSKLVSNVIADVLARNGVTLLPALQNFMHVLLENGRLAALPEVVAQFKALASARSGVAEATIYSAFPIEGQALADLAATLEQRFGRKLNAKVEIQTELIGGIRAVVGDEVLDTSVKARLEQMRVALTA